MDEKEAFPLPTVSDIVFLIVSKKSLTSFMNKNRPFFLDLLVMYGCDINAKRIGLQAVTDPKLSAFFIFLSFCCLLCSGGYLPHTQKTNASITENILVPSQSTISIRIMSGEVKV